MHKSLLKSYFKVQYNSLQHRPSGEDEIQKVFDRLSFCKVYMVDRYIMQHLLERKE